MTKSKLGGFGALAVAAKTPEKTPENSAQSEARTAPKARGRKVATRGAGDVVALSLRITRRDWVRLHELAITDGRSLSDLMRDGLSRVLRQKGLAPLEDPNA